MSRGREYALAAVCAVAQACLSIGYLHSWLQSPTLRSVCGSVRSRQHACLGCGEALDGDAAAAAVSAHAAIAREKWTYKKLVLSVCLETLV